MNYYKTQSNLLSYFKDYDSTIQRDGYVVLNKDNELINSIIEPENESRCLYFSIDKNSDVRATNLCHNPEGISFTLWIKQVEQGQIQLRVFGIHNVYNALAAILSMLENLPIKTIINGIKNLKEHNDALKNIVKLMAWNS